MVRSWGNRLEKKSARVLEHGESIVAGMLVIRVGRIERPVWTVEPAKQRTPPHGVPQTFGATLPLAGVIGLTSKRLLFFASGGSKSLRSPEVAVQIGEVTKVKTTDEARFLGVAFSFGDGSTMAYDAPKAGRPSLFLDAMEANWPELFS
jgi:hypothetical protein